MKFKLSLIFIVILLFSTVSMSESLQVVKEIEGLDHPESFIYDPVSDSYFISSIGGDPSRIDGDGFISRLDGSLEKLSLKWVTGDSNNPLNAPKGLAIYDGILFVSDIDHLRGYSIKTGKNVLNYKLSDDKNIFLNDVTVDDDGSVYTTCTSTGAIYRYTQKHKSGTLWFKNKLLKTANGILYSESDKHFIVGDPARGKIFKLNPTNKQLKLLFKGAVGVDGLDFDDDGVLFFSTFRMGRVRKLIKPMQATTVLAVRTSTADISIDRKHNYLLVPMMLSNKAVIYQLN